MTTIKSLGMFGLVMIMLFACNPTAEISPQATTTITSAPENDLPDTATPTITPNAITIVPLDTATPTPPPLNTTVAPTDTQEPAPFSLSDPGPWSVGKRFYRFQDPSREGRVVEIAVWYPAVLLADQTG